MLYECSRCGKLVDEDNGIIVHESSYSIFLHIMNMVFICKKCLSRKGREIFEKAKTAPHTPRNL